MKKAIVLIVMLIAICCSGEFANAKSYQEPVATIESQDIGMMRLGSKKTKQQKKKIQQRRNRYFAKSAFIGNSISVGLEMYFDSQGANYLGNPVMLVKGSYSFQNDKGTNSSRYQLSYRGRMYKAKDAIKASKVERVFISTGFY